MSKAKEKESDVIVRPSTAVSADTRPEHLRGREIVGVDLLKGYIVPPRLKFVQPQSKAPFSDNFNKGDVVLVPQMELIAPVELNAQGKPSDKGTPIAFTPIYFYPEWCCWNPIQTKGQLDSIRARTLDPKTELAHKARNKELWFEKCPEKPEFSIRYVEHLNFLIMLHGVDIGNIPVVVSFARTGHRAGTNLAALIKMRNADPFGCIFQLQMQFTQNESGEWYQPQVTNPSAELLERTGLTPWVEDAAAFKAYEELHYELKQKHADAKIQVEYEDPSEEGAADPSESTKY